MLEAYKQLSLGILGLAEGLKSLRSWCISYLIHQSFCPSCETVSCVGVPVSLYGHKTIYTQSQKKKKPKNLKFKTEWLSDTNIFFLFCEWELSSFYIFKNHLRI